MPTPDNQKRREGGPQPPEQSLGEGGFDFPSLSQTLLGMRHELMAPVDLTLSDTFKRSFGSTYYDLIQKIRGGDVSQAQLHDEFQKINSRDAVSVATEICCQLWSGEDQMHPAQALALSVIQQAAVTADVLPFEYEKLGTRCSDRACLALLDIGLHAYGYQVAYEALQTLAQFGSYRSIFNLMIDRLPRPDRTVRHSPLEDVDGITQALIDGSRRGNENATEVLLNVLQGTLHVAAGKKFQSEFASKEARVKNTIEALCGMNASERTPAQREIFESLLERTELSETLHLLFQKSQDEPDLMELRDNWLCREMSLKTYRGSDSKKSELALSTAVGALLRTAYFSPPQRKLFERFLGHLRIGGNSRSNAVIEAATSATERAKLSPGRFQRFGEWLTRETRQLYE